MTQVAVTDAQIAETAYLLWLDEGQPEGRAEAHWLEARTRLETAPAKPARKRAAPKAKAAAPKTAAAPKAAKASAAAKAVKAPTRKRASAKVD
ncbi:DUF2934 domain-containing protein [Mesobacterium pallidum]|uniref:DUF2934 domain-containing protein n=1 Tax=Mesobacterium pallidum TaxID=2872037 RepID=UPI001EE2A1A5|nr:DUF2934 domain-containing protein [Mesobacterium pallidum]